MLTITNMARMQNIEVIFNKWIINLLFIYSSC